MDDDKKVNQAFDPANPPVLSESQKARLDAVASMPDEEIDYSDAPPRTDAAWVKPAHYIAEPMKCPACGAAELARDITHTHNGQAAVIPAVTGDFCPACGKTILDANESNRVMRGMRENPTNIIDGEK